MQSIPEKLVTACLICIGIWTLFNKGMLLGWLGDVYERRLPEWINKPLWSCPQCMASVHGTWIWFAWDGPVELWIPFCLALCGLNRIVSDTFLR